MRVLYLLIALTLLLSSCSNKFSLQKRKYNKGFYFASSGRKGVHSKPQINNSELIVNKNSEIEPIVIDSISPENTLVFEEVKSEHFKPSPRSFFSTIKNSYSKVAVISNDKLSFEKSFAKNSDVSKTKNKNGLLDILYKAYIGYIAVMVIVALIYLLVVVSATYSIQQILIVIAVAIAAILILSAIGSLFTGGF